MLCCMKWDGEGLYMLLPKCHPASCLKGGQQKRHYWWPHVHFALHPQVCVAGILRCMNVVRRNGREIFWALPEMCLLALRQRGSSYKAATPWRTPKSMLFSHRKSKSKTFQLSVKFPASAPKHRRAGISQRISFQSFLS